MSDAAAIAAAALTLRARQAKFLLATVVRIEGSSYRRPGARLIATTEGRVAGSISGGCLERDLLRTGFWRARQGPVLVRYDSREPEEGQPILGCGGVVDVLLEQGTAGADDDPMSSLVDAVAANRPLALATVFGTTDRAIRLGARFSLPEDRGDDHARYGTPGALLDLASAGSTVLASERAACLDLATGDGRIDVLVEPILPPPHLFVLGAGADALPLVTMARQLGWRVTAWVAAEALASRSLLSAAGAAVQSDLEVVRARVDASHRALAVVMGHNVARDREALRQLLPSRATYIGVLGPRSRTASLAADLSFDLLADPRVHAPVGLDLGAETPEEIALSITSEILAGLRRASGAALRQRGSIHGSAA